MFEGKKGGAKVTKMDNKNHSNFLHLAVKLYDQLSML